jgi:hypothetical protein
MVPTGKVIAPKGRLNHASSLGADGPKPGLKGDG